MSTALISTNHQEGALFYRFAEWNAMTNKKIIYNIYPVTRRITFSVTASLLLLTVHEF